MHDVAQTWLLARSTGLLAYAVLTLTVVAGLTLRTRLFGRAVPPKLVGAVHQTLSLAGLFAVGAHIAALMLDTKVDVPLVAVLVPGMASYRPLATGLGVAAFELWVLIHLSFRVRRRIGVQRWRSLHKLTFVVWALALVHGLATGTDSSLPWVQEGYAISAALVIGLLGWRSLTASRRGGTRPPAPRAPRSPHPPPIETPHPRIPLPPTQHMTTNAGAPS